MTEIGFFQILLYLIALTISIKPLGLYIAKVYEDKPCGLNYIVKPLENFIYRLCAISPKQEMNWITYLKCFFIFNFLSFVFIYFIQRLQFFLPLNPQQFQNVHNILSFNTAISFMTNTNWQSYSGEKTMSYLTQMLGVTVQNFLSAASGLSIMVAFIRGLVRTERVELGNFWVDLTRSIFYILLPLSILFAVFLSSQGVIQNFKPYQKIHLIDPLNFQHLTPDHQLQNQTIHHQIIPMGPVASQVAIKQLGTNGGGFFNTNSAHPFENPTPLTNFFEMLAIILIPASLPFTFGKMIGDERQGIAILIAMTIFFIPMIFTTVISEQCGNPLLKKMAIDQTAKNYLFPGGNMEGKETRFGINSSALWTTATTATSNGSVNSMLDSYMPFSSIAPFFLMHLGEIVFGGLGSGLYGMLTLIIVTVFVAGLMVGRTPEYLGKKIEPFEIKMASLIVLIIPTVILLLTSIAVMIEPGKSAISNLGPHGFSEILYAFTSMANNNGSAFAGLNANNPFYNILGGMVMLIGRFWIAIPTLAIAGSLVTKKTVPVGLGTLATHTPLFIILLIFIALIFAGLSFFPALALGPIVEHLLIWSIHRG